MKKLLYFIVLAVALPSLLLTSCKDDSDDVVIEFDLLKSEMTTNGLDLGSVIGAKEDGTFFVKKATTENYESLISSHHIIDIRSADKYATSHIKGAVNIVPVDGDLSGLLAEAANAGTKPILIACYTGQNACYATALLRMAGYNNTFALKWGMSGWNSTTDVWSSKIASPATNHVNWSDDDTELALTQFIDPVINTSKTVGDEILFSRVKAVLAEGLKSVSPVDVLETPTNYFINNFFVDTDYKSFGHIAGAYRIKPLNLQDDLYLNLDPSKKVVTYCYTGQTSAVITAWLRVLGYDAYSLLFGMNGLYNDNTAWSTNQWGPNGDSHAYNLPFE